MKKQELYKLANPAFILSVVVLLLNDFYLKQTFGNIITGKLSDFAGLFAFPFFLSCLFPKYKKIIHPMVLLLFILWKSNLSQPFIDFVNSAGIPITRVVDFTDNIALISIFISYYIFKRDSRRIELKPIYTWCVIIISSFSFMATSLPRRTAIEFTSVNKQYEFAISKENFISQFNELQRKEIEKMSCKACNFGYFDVEKGVFYSKNQDTLAYIIDIDKHKDSDTIKINNYFADFQISRKGSDTTVLKLINIATSIRVDELKNIPTHDLIYETDSVDMKSIGTHYSYGYPVRSFSINPNDSKWKGKAIKEFEKRFVRKIKKG